MKLTTTVQATVHGWETSHGEMEGTLYDNLTMYIEDSITPRQNEQGSGTRSQAIKLKGEGMRYSAILNHATLPVTVELAGELVNKKNQYGQEIQQFEAISLRLVDDKKTKAA